MPGDFLTKKQKSLIDEIEMIVGWLGLDWRRVKRQRRNERTDYLEHIKRQLILGQVVRGYTAIDECLNTRLRDYFFGRRESSRKTKKFQYFKHHILERMSVLEKLRFVKSFSYVPKEVATDIEKINGLRNGLAHSFFPEQRERSKPVYKGKDIFSTDGIGLFMVDLKHISWFFFYGPKRRASKTATNRRAEAGQGRNANPIGFQAFKIGWEAWTRTRIIRSRV
jgi:hypothetical protein